ncbi:MULTISPECIES: hypothetical protein, partial [unclassified Neisseria]|uniref:hypothetical protein n=1 Tax=unclassified Neisseria TaxID=2623750 RepID=UPI001ADD7EC2
LYPNRGQKLKLLHTFYTAPYRAPYPNRRAKPGCAEKGTAEAYHSPYPAGGRNVHLIYMLCWRAGVSFIQQGKNTV